MLSCARATRGLRRPSLDTRSGKPSSQPSREMKYSGGRSMCPAEATQLTCREMNSTCYSESCEIDFKQPGDLYVDIIEIWVPQLLKKPPREHTPSQISLSRC